MYIPEKIAEGFKGEKAIVTPYNIRDYMRADKITGQLYVTHIGYYPNAKNHLRIRETGTDENILICCEKGKGWVEYSGEKFKLTNNQIFVIPAGASHSYGADNKDPWSIYWLHFTGKNTDLFDSVIGKLITLEESDNSRYKDRFDLFESIYKNLEMGYSPENLEYITFCLMHLLASVKYLPQYRQLRTVKVDDVIQQSIMFMKENLENKISLDDIANEVGYSRSHLITLFTQKTSYPPMVYYNQLRIQRACGYLQFSELKIKEIAFKLGFYDPYHFSKAFTAEMGRTPKAYREKYREK